MLKINYRDFPLREIPAGTNEKGEVIYIGDTVQYYEMSCVVVYRHGDIMIKPIGADVVISTNLITEGNFSGIVLTRDRVDDCESVVLCDENDSKLRRLFKNLNVSR